MTKGWGKHITLLKSLYSNFWITFKVALLKANFWRKEHYPPSCNHLQALHTKWFFNFFCHSCYDLPHGISNHNNPSFVILVEHSTIKVCFILTWFKWQPFLATKHFSPAVYLSAWPELQQIIFAASPILSSGVAFSPSLVLFRWVQTYHVLVANISVALGFAMSRSPKSVKDPWADSILLT